MDTGTTAFMLCCIIGLTLMIPGLALFYGGMVSVKSSTNMMMMTFGAVALVGVLWVLFGFSMVFGTSYGGFVGSFTEFAGMKDLMEPMTTVAGLPVSLFSIFQALFAAITVALISGAVADRMKFGAWMIFAAAWAVLVYFPVAHWVFAFDGVVTENSVGGWIANKLHAIDFAGGTAVHINAGAAALAVAIVLGKSAMFGQLRKPHNVPLTLLGAGMLWAGWYAFNGGSALAAGNSAAIVMVTTFVATCAATLAWIGVEKLKDGHVTGVGAASGAITGLVAITPACGAVTPIGAIFVGAIAGAICVYAVGFKEKLGYDDSLDVVGVHLVGGVVGTLLIGFFASEGMPNATNGLFYGGGVDQLWKQAIAAGAVMAYSFAVAFAIAFVLKKTIGIRISSEEEEKGIDTTFHRDSAYELEFA
ncbi:MULTISPECIES: ammonium transporter [Mycolicibacterium]|jgi:Amt family ammonium transporter|uniref:Ammonium transporter n=3 Tax=Mycolicibacterium TaxID=1866885 RepID=A0A378WAZ3_9MYCO|nr:MULTISPECIES: ammonium transporter [Mycolicibacterium]KLI10180.1 ammonia channel protein [Mycolicibacterium senegalense]KLO54947.1 ammonia channel protein [Mycolicibacterium senegalense]KMV14675.1 ammonia channel protein [Mycolicibacterium conceptionense]MCV7337254.1 ammonium transporter [Mycolicibacterium senegalense]MCW1821272.1 ammonium transporter [Mycolicibacterium senegalense]